MRKSVFALAATFMAVTVSMPASASIEDYVGVWEYKGLQTAGVSRLEITRDKNTLVVRTLGACGVPCDWGTVQAAYFSPKGNKVKEEFVMFQQRAWSTENLMILKPAGPDQVRLEFFRHFPQNPNATSFSLTYNMTRLPGVMPGELKAESSQAREDCLGFDTGQVRANRAGATWKVVSAAVWLLESLPAKGPAETGARVIRHYRMDRQCSVGTPEATMHYYLVNGGAPSGPMQGEDCKPFERKGIKVKKGKLVARGNVLIFDFLGDKGEARRAKKLIGKYKFTNVCFISRDNPRITYFRK